MTEERVYYKIRLLDNIGEYNEWHCSNNGTDNWSSLSKIKAILTVGTRSGYKGMYSDPFKNYEVIKVTEKVDKKYEIVMKG